MKIEMKYKFVVSITMLFTYLTVTVASCVVSLTCSCHHHLHSSDVHTAFAHTHQCDCSSEHSHLHSLCQGCVPQMSEKCCHCNHDHSTEIRLYTQPRSVDDDILPRYAFLLAIAGVVINDSEVQAAATSVAAFDKYTLPPLLEAHRSADGLRAPPVLV